jgi:hypothetical protein
MTYLAILRNLLTPLFLSAELAYEFLLLHLTREPSSLTPVSAKLF